LNAGIAFQLITKTKRLEVFWERKTYRSNIDNARKFLYAVKQNVSLFDGRLVLIVFRIRTVGFDDATHFVDSAVQPTSSNETGKFSIKFNSGLIQIQYEIMPNK
jgi:hypothetical protein